MNRGRVIRYRDLAPVAWKNGLGVTREIALEPTGALDCGFRFRMSRAEITATAMFSRFPGIRRWLVLAKGGALELRFADGALAQLDRVGDHFRFDGDTGVEGVPLDGASEDFNLMLADPALDAELLARPMVGSMVLHQPAQSWLAFHLLDGHAQVQGEGGRLESGDTMLFDPQPRDRLAARIDGGGMALLVRIFASPDRD